SISWATVLTASSGIGSTFWYYDHIAGTYTVGGGFDEIPTGQGFWLLSTAPSPQLIFPEASKTLASNSELKTAKSSLPFMSLSFMNTDNGYNQKLYVGPAQGASGNFEVSFDHPFHKSPNHNAPAIYATTNDGKKVVINAFEDGVDEIRIPLSLEVGVSGSYKLIADQLEYTSTFSCVTLTDRVTGMVYDLRVQNEITLELNAGDNYENRFELGLSNGDCSITQKQQTSSVEILHKQTHAQVNFHFNSDQQVSVSITNLMGQSIVSQVNFIANENMLNIELPSDFRGMYLVSVQNGSETITGKLVKQ
ncbi:MAG: T9SS type A sorting domain-containing protein, partial [Flavobacteriales bacterium]